jgi:F-type H+-transporting ATPase subunit gamma
MSANLKTLKTRIHSIKSTRKITKAMQMVSASKLRKASENLHGFLPYYKAVESILVNAINSIDQYDIANENIQQLLFGRQGKERYLFIICGTDRGLCGGFNSNVIKASKQAIIDYTTTEHNCTVITLGNKINSAYKNIDYVKKEKNYNNLAKELDAITKELGSIITQQAIVNYGKIFVCYNKFISPIKQEPIIEQIYPIKQVNNQLNYNEFNYNNKILLFEPSPDIIIQKLLFHHLQSEIKHALLQTIASEHASRMSAMDNATRNASDMIENLTLQYNRSRQAIITNELIEIISGAEAI